MANLLPFARGCYQRALLSGQARWSGADLKGRARQYGGRYAASRRALLKRIQTAGYVVVWTTDTQRRKIPVFTST